MIRLETALDAQAIRRVNELAFGGTAEASLIEAIRGNGHATLSLVAEKDGLVVGHILFSPVGLSAADGWLGGMALAPMAVLPACQRQGIGSSLVREGLRQLDETSCPFVVVVGHPSYYPRFGFEPARHYGMDPPWDFVNGDAFFIRFLPGLRPVTGGTARYVPEFDAV